MDQAALQVIADSPASDNVYYLVAMGGGGEEGALGTINNFNLTAKPGVKVSSDLAGFLSGYRFSAVEEGCSVAKLVDVQAAFPSLTFFAPPATSCGYICHTLSCLSNGQSFGLRGGSTVLYAIPDGPPSPCFRAWASANLRGSVCIPGV